MKTIKLIIAAVLVMAGMSVSAQWTTSGSDIYYDAGKVGIGTTAPSNLLVVGQNYAGLQIIVHNQGGVGGAGYEMRDDLSGNRWRFKSYATGGKAGFKIRDHANLIDVITIENNALQDAIFIQTGGNVGIGGNTNPQTALDVNGTISADDLLIAGKITTQEVEVTLDGWSDYVFDEEYHLSPLNEVEKFIKENKHLPGIPSEKEIVENGLPLGEMNKLLMSKIEELTLYVIELQKEVNKLKNE